MSKSASKEELKRELKRVRETQRLPPGVVEASRGAGLAYEIGLKTLSFFYSDTSIPLPPSCKKRNDTIGKKGFFNFFSGWSRWQRGQWTKRVLFDYVVLKLYDY